MSDHPSPLKRTALIFAILFALIGLDQWTKEIAIDQLRGRPSRIFLGDLFRLEYAENPGAFLSLGAKLSPAMRFWGLSVTVAVVLLGFLGFTIRRTDMTRLQTVSLSLVIAGGLSNLIDRIFRPGGRVIDFMNMGIGDLRTGIFNIADMVIMAGMAAYLVSLYFPPKPAR